MAEQACPVCGCVIGVGAYQQEGVVYCCQACAVGERCECGECVTEEQPQEQ